MALIIPQNFIDAMASLYGANSGNPASPIWFCGLEWGGGFNPADPEDQRDPEDEYSAVNDLEPIKPEKLKQYLKGDWFGTGKGRPGGSAFYRIQVRLLKAIIDPEGYRYDTKAPYDWVDEYQFFNKDCYGLSLNAFPVTMKGRDKSPDKCWRENKVLKVKGKLLSFAEWTGIPNFYEYQNKCAEIRNRMFCALRREYKPAIIYCGGISNAYHLYQMWTDERDKNVKEDELKIGRFKLSYRWLNNEKNEDPTLLVVGYFFGSRNSLKSKEDILMHGKELRRLCDEKLGKDWLKKDKFLPEKHN